MSGLPQLFNFSMNALEQAKLAGKLTLLTAQTADNGIVITPQIAAAIVQARRQALEGSGMVELRPEMLQRFVRAFSTSAFVTQDTFAETVGELLELFYHIRREVEGEIADDDLISDMLSVFDDSCQGVIEVMQSRGLEKLLRRYKYNDNELWSEYERREYKIGYEEDWRE